MSQKVIPPFLAICLLSACGGGDGGGTTAPTASTTVTASYVSSSALIVPLNTVSFSPIVVGGQSGAITDLQVSVSVNSPQGLCILFLELHHPDGSHVRLKNGNQGPGSSCTETTWVTTYPTQTTPWEPLDRLFGKPTVGTWRLSAAHEAKFGFNLRLDNWTLRITTRP